ncbi:FAD:protein FMN transferase [Fulvitalea axinellae]|uniref:FAD:protein FMN transferase n=2 Tax=Fulvitalea axinellae TaxID=1182444 RepID=A0AAU9C759_9BACT|nr:FAD:protein FMN transferase [Fulvitalea axinellae]
MGGRFSITIMANDSAEAGKYLDLAITEIKRVEALISSWDKKSQTSEINRNAGLKPVKVDRELFKLIERSISLSKLTDGAFDISFASAGKLWRFDGSMKKLPTEAEIRKSVVTVDYRNIVLDKTASTVFLKTKGMKIGFGAVGKGYVADRVRSMLISEGVGAGIIDASGDLRVWGTRPDGEEWKIAITDPADKRKTLAVLPISSGAVVTSGNYEKFAKIDGKRYAHIIDPRTGWPARGLVSVTVFAPSAEIADALATSIFVMGTEAGLNRIDQMPSTECLIIDESGAVFTSKNIKINQP